MKKCIIILKFLFLINYATIAQMDVVFEQTRTTFVEGIEPSSNQNGVIGEVLDDHVPKIRTTAPDIGAFDSDQSNTALDYDYADQDDNNCGIGATGEWEPATHLENLARMAEGYALAVDQGLTTDANNIAAALILGLEYW